MPRLRLPSAYFTKRLNSHYFAKKNVYVFFSLGTGGAVTADRESSWVSESERVSCGSRSSLFKAHSSRSERAHDTCSHVD